MSFLGNIHGSFSRRTSRGVFANTKVKEFKRHAGVETKYVDLTIHFIGAQGLPKTDVAGSSDPYFVARIDHEIEYTSSVQVNTLQPVWNELWHLKNVPTDATLAVQVMDKDEGKTDDFVGKFETTVAPGAKEAIIQGPMHRLRSGTFWLNIESREPATPLSEAPAYTFDGPLRYTQHYSPTVGQLTRVNDARLYSTWEVRLRGVRTFFGDAFQHWNTEYAAAQSIFGAGPGALALRGTIRAGHRTLYAQTMRDRTGPLDTPADVLALLHSANSLVQYRSPVDPRRLRVKPAVYTYVIAEEDETLRFSETGATFFVDFASKHALHANCAKRVRYSGEFHPRPTCPGGWAGYGDGNPDADADERTHWELAIDNNSGTYAPSRDLLPTVRALLEYNFPGFAICALDREDPGLKESREACREYALRFRGVKQEELQPHIAENEQTLLNHIAGSPELVQTARHSSLS
ncbi:hypothetical protein EDB86DRAFT_1823419 [Lactarius hatsudake]|nr:hypothetical protein EDB86DRAFT_1823419 [Lactarius hatsudake]